MSKLLEYKGYHASIEYDAEDNLFVGEVIGITDSLNFHGTSVDELQVAFAASIDDYLEMCQTYGKEPDKEYKGSFNVRVGHELHKKLVLEAAEQDKSINQIVFEAIENYFNPKEKVQNIYISNELMSVMLNGQNLSASYKEVETAQFVVEEDYVNV